MACVGLVLGSNNVHFHVICQFQYGMVRVNLNCTNSQGALLNGIIIT